VCPMMDPEVIGRPCRTLPDYDVATDCYLWDDSHQESEREY